jgi:hypothetical protein
MELGNFRASALMPRHCPALNIYIYNSVCQNLPSGSRGTARVRFCQGISQYLSWVFSVLSVFSPEHSCCIRPRSSCNFHSVSTVWHPAFSEGLLPFPTGYAGFQRSDLDFKIWYKPQPTIFPFSCRNSPWRAQRSFRSTGSLRFLSRHPQIFKELFVSCHFQLW